MDGYHNIPKTLYSWNNTFWDDFWSNFEINTNAAKIISQPYTSDNTFVFSSPQITIGDYIFPNVDHPMTLPNINNIGLNKDWKEEIFEFSAIDSTYPEFAHIKDKEELAKAIRFLLDKKDYVFGGYVRDRIAGKSFNDLDIFLFDSKETETGEVVRRNFFKKLQETFGVNNVFLKKTGVINYKASSQDEESAVDTYRDKLSITCGTVKLDVDLITNAENDPFFDYDCDINAVLMRKDGTIEAAPKGNLTEIIQHIKDEVWVPWDEMPKYRIDDFYNRGYRVAQVDNYRGLPGLITSNENKKINDAVLGEIEEQIFNGGGMQLTRNNKRVKRMYDIRNLLYSLDLDLDLDYTASSTQENILKLVEEAKEHCNKLNEKFSNNKEFSSKISNISHIINTKANELINPTTKKSSVTLDFAYVVFGIDLFSDRLLDGQTFEKIKRKCLTSKDQAGPINPINKFELKINTFGEISLSAWTSTSYYNEINVSDIFKTATLTTEEKNQPAIDFAAKEAQDKETKRQGNNGYVVFNPTTGPQVIATQSTFERCNAIPITTIIDGTVATTQTTLVACENITSRAKKLSLEMREKGLIIDTDQSVELQTKELEAYSEASLDALQNFITKFEKPVGKKVVNTIAGWGIKSGIETIIPDNKELSSEDFRELSRIFDEKDRRRETTILPKSFVERELKWVGSDVINNLSTNTLIGLNESNIFKLIIDPTNKGWKEETLDFNSKISNTPLYSKKIGNFESKIYCCPDLDADTILVGKCLTNDGFPMWENSTNLKTFTSTVLSQTATPTVTESQDKMDEEVTFLDTLKDDAEDAAYRVASTQMTKAAKTALLKLLQQKGTKKSQVTAFKELLDSAAGDAIISLLMGAGLTFIPNIKDDPRAKQLAKEFRVNGMATAANSALEALMSDFLPGVLQTLQTLPQPESKVRIGEKETPKMVKKDHVEEEHRAEAEVAELKAVPNHKAVR